MYEHMTFEYILQNMLDRVPNTVDKREGSIIYDALAPAAAELSQMYIELDIGYNLSFADTSTGECLTRRTAEFGVNRESTTKAIRKGLFLNSNNQPFDIPIGSRYSIEDLNYVAIKKLNTGQFEMQCETEGTVGNQLFGELIPIQFIDGLSRGELTDVLIPGENEEDDETLRKRFYELQNAPVFGGNISDYKQKINALDGVGGTRVFPTWKGGGTVKCTIIASDFTSPTTELVNKVQTIIDPFENQGKGLGTAPIGHVVTIAGVRSVKINLSTTLTLENGYTQEQVQAQIESVIQEYLLQLRKSWTDTTNIIVRVALIDAAILTVQGVLDVTETTLNGNIGNITLGEEEIPILEVVSLNV